MSTVDAAIIDYIVKGGSGSSSGGGGSSGGGSSGGVGGDDQLTRCNGQEGYSSENTFIIECADSSIPRARSGNIIKFRNRSNYIVTHILVMQTNEIPSEIGADNAVLIDDDYDPLPIKVWNRTGTYLFVIPASSGYLKEFTDDESVGLFANTNMSMATMQKVLRYSNGSD